MSLEQINGDEIVIVGDDVHYVATVLRKRPGDTLTLVGPDGSEYLARIESLQLDSPAIYTRVVRTHRPDREPAVKVSLAQALIKGDKMDFVIQKCTELGAYEFIPFVARRSVVRLDDRRAANRVERWRRVATAAAQQSGRLLIPSVSAVRSLKELVTLVKEQVAQRGSGSVILAWEGETGTSLFDALHRRVGLPQSSTQPEQDHLLLIIGPEGGFDLYEAQQLIDAGAEAVTIGDLILRTETAGMAALAMILYHTGDLGRARRSRQP